MYTSFEVFLWINYFITNTNQNSKVSSNKYTVLNVNTHKHQTIWESIVEGFVVPES